MVEVKIREVIESITISGPMGMKSSQPFKFLQLYFSKSGEVVPDNIYTLKQGEREQMCNVTRGQARGVEWLDHSKPMFLV